MATHISHSGLPFPVKGARYTVEVPYLDADGDPTDPTTPDTEISVDGAEFVNCVEEVTTIVGSNGAGFITLTGAEMNASSVFLAAKVASGPKATLVIIKPRIFPILIQGTAQAGAAGTITLAAATEVYDFTGCIVKTTGGTGGGGVGGANNQARLIVSYDTDTQIATIEPNWETAPDDDTTYDILLTDMAAKIDAAGMATDIAAEMDAGDLGAAIAAELDTGGIATAVVTAMDLPTLVSDIVTEMDLATLAAAIVTDMNLTAVEAAIVAGVDPAQIAADVVTGMNLAAIETAISDAVLVGLDPETIAAAVAAEIDTGALATAIAALLNTATLSIKIGNIIKKIV